MPDPSLPHLIMLSTPRTPQPYQERILAALEDGSRLETYSERWEIHATDALREQCIRRRERARIIAMLDHAEARDRHRDHSRNDD